MVAVLLVTVPAGWLLLPDRMNPNDEEPRTEVPAEVSLNTVNSQASAYIAQGEVDQAFIHYDEQISQAQDDRTKKSLLVKKSLTARDVGQYELAIASARQADEIASDTQTMRALADAYAANGDNENALVYYRKLLDIKKATELDESEGVLRGMESGPSLESIIEDLER